MIRLLILFLLFPSILYAQAIGGFGAIGGGGSGNIPTATVATLPAAATATNKAYIVTDGADSSDCTIGTGTDINICISNGTIWVFDGDGAGAGQAVILDLGDDEANESTDVGEIAVTGDTNSIFTEPGADKLLIAVGNDWPKADVADEITCVACVAAAELHADYLLETELDSEAELETQVVAGGNIIISTEIDTYAEVDALVADQTLLHSALGGAVTGDWDFGGGGIEIENSTSVPGSCTVGQLFLDTDATSGAQLYACESGSFVLQTGGGGGSGDVTDVFDCATGDCNTPTVAAGESLTFADDVFGAIFGTDGDWTIGYDETTDDTLEIHSNLAGATNINIANTAASQVANLTIDGSVTGSSFVSTLVSGDVGYARLSENPDNGSNYMAFQSPASVTANISLILPDGDGSDGDVLRTDGSATLSWDTPLYPDDAVFDFGASVFEVSNGTSGTTDATGEMYLDTNGDTTNITDPMLQIYDGAANKYLLPIALPLAASQDNYVIKYDAAGKTVQWEADAGAAGGDSLSIDSVAVVDPDFVSTGDIDFVDTSNTVTANINANSIVVGDVADGDWGAFTMTTNVAALDANTVDSASYVDGSIDSEHLAATPTFTTPVIGVATGTSLALTGNLTATVPVTITTAATLVLTTANTAGNLHINGDADAVDFTLPGAAAGLSACFYAAEFTGVITIDPVDGTDTIYLNGVSVGAGDAIDSPGTVGDMICLIAADSTKWYTLGQINTWVDGGVD